MGQRRRVPWMGEDTFIHNQSRKQSRKGNAVFRTPRKRTLLLPSYNTFTFFTAWTSIY